jgi:hypothetical protein
MNTEAMFCWEIASAATRSCHPFHGTIIASIKILKIVSVVVIVLFLHELCSVCFSHSVCVAKAVLFIAAVIVSASC